MLTMLVFIYFFGMLLQILLAKNFINRTTLIKDNSISKKLGYLGSPLWFIILPIAIFIYVKGSIKRKEMDKMLKNRLKEAIDFYSPQHRTHKKKLLPLTKLSLDYECECGKKSCITFATFYVDKKEYIVNILENTYFYNWEL